MPWKTSDRYAEAGARSFTKAKRATFFGTLAATCNIARSAREAGVSETYVYRLCHTDPSFLRAWQEAMREAAARLEMTLLERSINGRVRTVWHAGKRVGREKEVSDRLGLAMLDRMHRNEPSEEPEDEDARAEALRADITAKIEAVRKRLAADQALLPDRRGEEARDDGGGGGGDSGKAGPELG